MSNEDRARAAERARLQAGLADALANDDDPLAAYDQFIKWTIDNYPEGHPNSGLSDLLRQATTAFINEPIYKTDIRYLKLWILHARSLALPEGIAALASLMSSGIGTSYSTLYEEYARLLELNGQVAEADKVYRKGIKRQVRPLDRLKTRYRDFQSRQTSTATDLDRTPTQPAVLQTDVQSRYAPIFAPPAAGKRKEVPQFDLALLLSDKEYCIQEARAKSLGLYGKKWPPPPPPVPIGASSSASSSSSMGASMRVNFNDDGQTSSRLKRRRSTAEPTVTINTREALEDVFGMFNSPEKTAKLAAASIRKIEPATPMAPPPTFRKSVNENENARTPATFRPFVDENSVANNSRKENTPAKFVPYVDPEEGKTPTVIAPRPVLGTKEAVAPRARTLTEENKPIVKPERSVFKVFTPAPDQQKPVPLPLRDVFTDDHGKPQQRPTHERAKSYQDPASAVSTSLRPLTGETRTPFKVFSRPEEGQNPSAAFTPFKDPRNVPPPAFTPYRDPPETKQTPSPPAIAPSPPPSPPSQGSWAEKHVEVEQDHYEQDFQYDNEDDDGVGDYLPPEDDQPPPEPDQSYEDTGEESYQVPLGGRWGQINVMTPITERTFEYTMNSTARSSAFGETPSRVLTQLPEDDDNGGSRMLWRDERHAIEAADQLAAELREGQQLGGLRLADTLKLASDFKPPNPCNAFDDKIMSAMLSLTSADQHCIDLQDQEANTLDMLQKFATRSRKGSGGGSYDNSLFPLNIAGHRFSVCEKLGEGGFGAVFKAKDLGTNLPDDSDDEDEDDDVSLVAIKVVKPRNTWEYRVLRRLHSSLAPSLRPSVILPQALFAFRDESYLVMDLCPQGTLLNVVNGANAAQLAQAGGTLDELLVMFFSIELLRVVEGLHSIGFIHGDLKIDNCLLRLETVPGGAAAWSNVYNPSGDDGWRYKGLKLIDFGRTIDTRLFPPGQQFIADWETNARDCFELREGRPWTYQTDYFGLAGIVYCLLFGKYIEAESVVSRDGRYRLASPLKRYWQKDIWEPLFELLLNPSGVREDSSLPLNQELSEIRGQMESWLQANCQRTSNPLKALLRKIERDCI
ncbi:hypothetical protein MIND_00240900 [Mycena indigotica]|uniref:Uncharacterized protein n=1 Tax=Mycena indigotica TaxID=2126181 RepID=A0A8H6WHA3_9AGAR|nr:uncharacterized protein MIND_00240900 [Mycena indigotica]KAF7312279.1 hypothetical protein MIND_00240900 [Mycena indigotica]